MRESAVEKKACDYAKSLGFMVFKFTAPGQRGVPDRLFIRMGGEHLHLEFKAPGQKPDAVQRAMMERLRKQGVACGWTDNAAEAAAMISDFHGHPALFNKMYPL